MFVNAKEEMRQKL